MVLRIESVRMEMMTPVTAIKFGNDNPLGYVNEGILLLIFNVLNITHLHLWLHVIYNHNRSKYKVFINDKFTALW